MKIATHFRRHIEGFRSLPICSMPGVRYCTIENFSHKELRPYFGTLSRHLLILMRAGTVIVRRRGQVHGAGAGGAVLVPAGDVELSFHRPPGSGAVIAELVEFDHRRLADMVSGNALYESLALKSPHPSVDAVNLPKFGGWNGSQHCPAESQHADRARMMMSIFINQPRRGLFEFLRDHFYRRRWELCIMMEQSLLMHDAAECAAVKYPGGMKALRKDCRVFLEAEPMQIINRRRCQLASAWLRCGHSVEAVSERLGFDCLAQFQCVFSGTTGRSCAATMAMVPLKELTPEELVEILRPCWWPPGAPQKMVIPDLNVSPDCLLEPEILDDLVSSIDTTAQKSDRTRSTGQRDNYLQYMMDTLKVLDVSGDCESGSNAGAVHVADVGGPAPESAPIIMPMVPMVPPVREPTDKRKPAIDELMERAQPFFAMECTGAGIVVPIFDEVEDEADVAIAA